MSTWTVPATASTGAVSVAFWNTEVRDHLVWLKGFADLITNGTAADTGTATVLRIVRAAGGDDVIQARVTGDTNNRMSINSGGGITWGPGNAGGDVLLQRSDVDVLNTPDTMQALNFLVGRVDGGTGIDVGANAVLFEERGSDPAAAPAGKVRLYCRDNGSGKTQLCAIFASGVVQVLATQP